MTVLVIFRECWIVVGLLAGHCCGVSSYQSKDDSPIHFQELLSWKNEKGFNILLIPRGYLGINGCWVCADDKGRVYHLSKSL